MPQKLIAHGAVKSKICAPINLIAQGAEAKIIKVQDWIIKDRIKKSYRIPELDEKIRKQRTKAETKLLHKASKIINAPVPKDSKEKNKILMPFIDGKKLSEHLDKFLLKEQKQICRKIGEAVAKLHEKDIIHGDLTTSNMILKENKVFTIDFGLGFISHKYEDKAVDLHLLKQALEAKHFKNWDILIKEVFKEYLSRGSRAQKGYKKYKDSKTVLERLKAVEKRGRYKH